MFSSDPFQRLTAGGTFNRTLNIFMGRYDLFMMITSIIFVPVAFMMVSIFQFMGTSMHTMLESLQTQQNMNNMNSGTGYDNYSEYSSTTMAAGSDPFSDAIFQNLSSFGSQFILEYIALLVLSIAGEAAMTYAVAELYAGRDPVWLDCLKKGFSRWCDLFGSAFIVVFAIGFCDFSVRLLSGGFISTQNNFMVFLGVLVIVAWLVVVAFVMVSFMILAPVIMVEGSGPINSIKRCWELSWNNRCYIFCTIFCICVSYYVVQLVLTGILIGIGGQEAVFSIRGALLVVLPIMLYIPLNVMYVLLAFAACFYYLSISHRFFSCSTVPKRLCT